jgi:hypothetical protein
MKQRIMSKELTEISYRRVPISQALSALSSRKKLIVEDTANSIGSHALI